MVKLFFGCWAGALRGWSGRAPFIGATYLLYLREWISTVPRQKNRSYLTFDQWLYFCINHIHSYQNQESRYRGCSSFILGRKRRKEEEIVACGRFHLYRLRVFGDVGIREAEVLGVIGTSVAPLFFYWWVYVAVGDVEATNVLSLRSNM